MSPREFAASLLVGFLSFVLPLAIFIAMVAVAVYVARWWIARKGSPPR
jgi:hypothetical protein